MAARISSKPAGIDEQLWPIVCATTVLAGIVGVIVAVNGDFEEDRLFLNGYTHLAGLGVAAALLIFIASRLKGAARRTAELAIVLSLAWHTAAGVGAFLLFQGDLGGWNSQDAARDAWLESDDESLPPDYHWAQDEEQHPEQAFEKAVSTTIREQTPPAAQLQPRDVVRSAPVAEMPRVAKVEITPLGASDAPLPGEPLEIGRPDAAKSEEAKPPEALAMVRQKDEELPLPKSESPAPAAMAEAPKERPQSPEPFWASVAKQPDAPPRKMARVEVQPGQSLPSPDLIARLPLQAPPQSSNSQAGPEAADKISQQGITLLRSDHDGLPLPSTVVPDAGLPVQAPSADHGYTVPDSSPPSRLEPISTARVEKWDTSRSGAIGGRGSALPSIEGRLPADPAEVRSGSPESSLSKGLALPSALARRANESQTEDGGSGSGANQAPRLPRTQSEMGWGPPAAAKIAERSAFSGTGGTASSSDGLASRLDVGQPIAVRRSAGAAGTPGRGVPRNLGTAAPGVGDLLPGNDGKTQWHSVPRAAFVGRGPIGPRRIEQGIPEGDDNGVGNIPRAQSEIIAPRPTATPAGPVAGAANVPNGLLSAGTLQGFSGQTIGPSAGLGGLARREVSGQGIGLRPSGTIEPTGIASSIGVGSPQSSGPGTLGGGHHVPMVGEGQLEQILSGGGPDLNRPGRGQSQIVVSGDVHEPMAPFRRGAVHGGLVIGDSAGGQLTEPAIENGLEYFAHTQFKDGHWSLHELPEGFAANSAELGELHADTAATGLALLTYLGAGYTHQDEKYRGVVRGGVAWLVKHQQPDGNLSYHGSDPTHYYSQGIAALALCEAYGMTQDREIREPAQKAIDFIVKSQDPNLGGWRYRPKEGSDTSVTGWQLMALKSAQMAGLEVPEDVVRKAGRWLDLAQVPNRGTYVYNPWNADTEIERLGRQPNPTMTAQAMVMRMYLGQDRDKAALALGADYLLAHLPDVGTLETPQRDCYYWYYATQAMYHMQGDYWKTWDARIAPLLRAGQIDRGPLKGSWSAREPVPDRWGREAGRHYVTSLHVLTLEFRYWHLPLFRELRTE